MRGHRPLVLIGIFFVGLAAAQTAAVWPARAESVDKDLSQKRKDLKEIKKEILLKREKEKEIRGKETSVLENLNDLETEFYRKSNELKRMEAQLDQTRGKLDQTKGQIAALNQGMGKMKEELFSRLNALYKMGRVSPRAFLFTSEPYLDLLRLDKYLRVIIDSDNRLVSTLQRQVTLKERFQADLAKDRLQWERSIAEVERKKEEVKKVREEKRVFLKSIQSEKAMTRKVIAELEGRAKELQVLVERLEKEKSNLAYGKAKPDSFRGKLNSPVQGSVISHFREKGQNGIEIRAPMESEVRAVLPGRVMYADWFKGFGNMVIIDHGDHTFTVSAYCSQLLKREGETVAQGEPVALVGSAGSLKGPCLYFEIRHRGKPQDPMEWISSPDRVVSVMEGNKKVKK